MRHQRVKRSQKFMDSQHVISRWGNDWLSKLHRGHVSESVKPARNKLDCVGKMPWMILS